MKKIMLNPVRNNHTGLKIFAAFCGGLALGLLMSPIKNGIGNNSGNITNHYHWDDELSDCGCDGDCGCGDECECGEDCERDKEEDA